MSLYPSLEDMNVSHMAQAQVQSQHGNNNSNAITSYNPSSSSLYAGLYGMFDEDEWMGMRPWQAPTEGTVVAVNAKKDVVSIKQGVRQLSISPDAKGKLGISVKSISKGVFVSCVWKEHNAALQGLRFGDQIIQVNGENVAGYDSKKALSCLHSATKSGTVNLVVRDRPFERTITLKKDSTGHIGFEFRNQEILRLRKESSAARNGLLIDHMMVEVQGLNVIGLKDNEILKIMENSPDHITLTVMPNMLYKHMIDNLYSALIKKRFDHTNPETI